MKRILVSGLISVETTVQVEAFPIHYSPVRYPFFGVSSAVSGVGYNISKALNMLGNSVRLLSMLGKDAAHLLVRRALEYDGINGKYVIDVLETTPQSVILYDHNGTRQVNVDLKDIQERVYPQVLFEQALSGCSIAILSNVNFSRPFLEAAKRAGKTVVTDVHAISNIEDDYNRDFMAAADILFMSHELLPTSPEDWARWIMHRYGTGIVVIGLGAEGALLGVKAHHHVERVPAVRTRPIVSTIGAGDAMLSAFVHCYNQTHNPYDAIRRAMVFASYKIGSASAADGFLTQDAFDNLCQQAQVAV